MHQEARELMGYPCGGLAKNIFKKWTGERWMCCKHIQFSWAKVCKLCKKLNKLIETNCFLKRFSALL